MTTPAPVHWATPYTPYDFGIQRYLVEEIDNERWPVPFSERISSRDFTPNALDYYVRRAAPSSDRVRNWGDARIDDSA